MSQFSRKSVTNFSPLQSPTFICISTNYCKFYILFSIRVIYFCHIIFEHSFETILTITILLSAYLSQTLCLFSCPIVSFLCAYMLSYHWPLSSQTYVHSITVVYGIMLHYQLVFALESLFLIIEFRHHIKEYL